MPPSESSPVWAEISHLRATGTFRLSGGDTPCQHRARIWKSIAAEEIHLTTQGRAYDPHRDCRVQWMEEWVQILEGRRIRFTHGLEATLRYLGGEPLEDIDPAGLSGKDRAAGEHLTLAQGS